MVVEILDTIEKMKLLLNVTTQWMMIHPMQCVIGVSLVFFCFIIAYLSDVKRIGIDKIVGQSPISTLIFNKDLRKSNLRSMMQVPMSKGHHKVEMLLLKEGLRRNARVLSLILLLLLNEPRPIHDASDDLCIIVRDHHHLYPLGESSTQPCPPPVTLEVPRLNPTLRRQQWRMKRNPNQLLRKRRRRRVKFQDKVKIKRIRRSAQQVLHQSTVQVVSPPLAVGPPLPAAALLDADPAMISVLPSDVHRKLVLKFSFYVPYRWRDSRPGERRFGSYGRGRYSNSNRGNGRFRSSYSGAGYGSRRGGGYRYNGREERRRRSRSGGRKKRSETQSTSSSGSFSSRDRTRSSSKDDTHSKGDRKDLKTPATNPTRA